jgi:hypothetical protein
MLQLLVGEEALTMLGVNGLYVAVFWIMTTLSGMQIV